MNDTHLEHINNGARRLGRVFLFEDEDDLLVWGRRHDPQTAHEIQARVLPARPPALSGYAFDFWCQPAAEVGGDHLNFCPAGGDSLGIVIADVSGKGIGAALIVTMLRATFHTQCWGNHNVRHVLARANSFISHALPPRAFVTCAYGLLDARARRFTFARAGHEPLLLVRDGRALPIAPTGLPLGISNEDEFLSCLGVTTLDLQPGDRLFFFTDGLTEAMNPAHEEFGLENIITVLENSDGNDITAMREMVALHCDGVAPHDDLTMVSLRVE